MEGRIPPIYCTHCYREIEHCEGIHGDWMHSADKRELCIDGQPAEPTLLNHRRASVQRRYNASRR